MNKLFRHPKIILAVTLTATLLLAAMLPQIVIDNDTKDFFPHDHPSYTRMEDLNDTFGSQIIMAISLTSKSGSVLQPESIYTMQELVDQIELLEFIEEVQALSNSDYPEGTLDGMKVAPIVAEDFQGTTEELEQIRAKLLDWEPMYRRTLYSDDFDSTQLIISIDEDISADEMSALYKEIESIVESTVPADFEYRIAGDPVLSERAKEYMYSDLSLLVPIVILVVMLTLYFSFHSLRGTLLPLMTVLISTIWTVGIMALFGVHFTVVSTCLPVLLIAVGSAYGIHVMNHYYTEIEHSEVVTAGDVHKSLVMKALARVRTPVLLAGFTTIVGFSSITTSPIVPLKDFGIFAAVGVAIALVLSLTFIPAILMVMPPKKMKQVRAAQVEKHTQRRRSALLNIYQFLSERRWRIISLTGILIALSIWGTIRLDVETALLDYFPADSEMRVDTDYISEEFGGSNSFSIVLNGEQKGDVITPEALKAMDDLNTYLKEHHPEIGKTLSFTDFIKRMNQIMNFPPAEVQNASKTTKTAEVSYTSTTSDETSSEQGSTVDHTGDDGFGSFDSFFEEEESSSEDSLSEDSSSSAETASAQPAQGSSATNKTIDPAEHYRYDEYSEDITYARFLQLMNDVMAGRSTVDMSAEELAKGIEKEFNYRGAAYYEIPYKPAKYPVETQEELKNLISQYLLLYSGSLDNYANDSLEPSKIRTLVQLKTHSTHVTDEIIKDIHQYAAEHLPKGYSLECTGIAEMENALTKMVTKSQITSLLTALVIVFLIVAFSFRSPVAGIFGVIPLGLAILINFGIMGLTGIKLDIITAIIASVAIGIGVDYTIHFLTNYHQERLKTDDLAEVSRNTLLLSGRAIIINAISVALGFVVLILSEFVVLRYIGILVAIIMITSSMAAMTVLPVLLNTFKPAFISRPVKNRKSEGTASGKEQHYA